MAGVGHAEGLLLSLETGYSMKRLEQPTSSGKDSYLSFLTENPKLPLTARIILERRDLAERTSYSQERDSGPGLCITW